MKFRVDSKELLIALKPLSKLMKIQKKEVLHNYIKFEIPDEVVQDLLLTASDVELCVVKKVCAYDIEGDGEFFLEQNKLIKCLHLIPKQVVLFEVNEETQEITVSYNGGFLILVYKPESYDNHPTKGNYAFQNSWMASISYKSFKEGLKKTFGFSAKDHSYEPLNVLHLAFRRRECIFLGTKGTVLVEHVANAISTNEFKMTIPSKYGTLLMDILDSEKFTEDIEIQCYYESPKDPLRKFEFPDLIKISVNGHSVFIKQAQKSHIEWDTFFDEPLICQCCFDGNTAIQALNRINSFDEEVRLALNVYATTLTMNSYYEDNLMAEFIKVFNMKGKDISIKVSSKLLLSVLKIMNGVVEFTFTENDQIILKSREYPELRAIVKPCLPES
jgi:hypothetical protein